jgi:hypothetical protein
MRFEGTIAYFTKDDISACDMMLCEAILPFTEGRIILQLTTLMRAIGYFAERYETMNRTPAEVFYDK